MAKRLTRIIVDEISSVDRGAGNGCRVMLMKQADGAGTEEKETDVSREVEFAKASIKTGVAILSRAMLTDAIVKRAAAIKRDGETDAQAFTRALLEDDDSKTLLKASKQAEGPDHIPEPPNVQTTREPGPFGRQMLALANDRLRAYPRKSPAQAYSEVYTAPANAELKEKVKREEMRAAMSAA